MGVRHLFPALVSDPAFYALARWLGLVDCPRPFASIVFLFELSHNPNALLPLIVCVMVSDGLCVCSAGIHHDDQAGEAGADRVAGLFRALLMRASIDQVMRKEFTVFQPTMNCAGAGGVCPGRPGADGRSSTRQGRWWVSWRRMICCGRMPRTPLEDAGAGAAGFCAGAPRRTGDEVHRDMMRKNTENVLVVATDASRKPIGLARANDILQLRRWLMEEETREPRKAHRKVAAVQG